MRHQTRHLHATVVKYITDGLTALGWTDTPAPFGTTPITILDFEPQAAGTTPAINTVAISLGDIPEVEEAELGGMRSRRYPVFVDIYPANEPIGIALADDVDDLFTDQVTALLDFTTDAAGVATDAQIEFESVLVENLTSASTTLDRRTWRAVKTVAVCYF